MNVYTVTNGTAPDYEPADCPEIFCASEGCGNALAMREEWESGYCQPCMNKSVRRFLPEPFTIDDLTAALLRDIQKTSTDIDRLEVQAPTILDLYWRRLRDLQATLRTVRSYQAATEDLFAVDIDAPLPIDTAA